MVEVRAAVVFWDERGRDYIVHGQGGWDDSDMREEAAARGIPLSAIITARVPLPRVPEIVATVEAGE